MQNRILRHIYKIGFSFFQLFRPRLALKLANSANKSQLNFILQKSDVGIIKRKILCWVRIRWKKFKEIHPKEVIGHNRHTVIKVKDSIFSYFSLITFLQLFHRIWNQHRILRFWIPSLHFWKINFSTCANFEVKLGWNGSKKRKMCFGNVS